MQPRHTTSVRITATWQYCQTNLKRSKKKIVEYFLLRVLQRPRHTPCCRQPYQLLETRCTSPFLASRAGHQVASHPSAGIPDRRPPYCAVLGKKLTHENPWYSQDPPTVSPEPDFRSGHSGNGVQGAGGMSQRPSPPGFTLGQSRSRLRLASFSLPRCRLT